MNEDDDDEDDEGDEEDEDEEEEEDGWAPVDDPEHAVTVEGADVAGAEPPVVRCEEQGC